MPPVAPAQQTQASPTTALPTQTESQKPIEPSSIDLVKRAASIPQQEQKPQANEAPKVSLTMDEVKDPAARAILEKKLAEANTAISKTFGEIGADKAKYMQEVETLRKQLEASTNKKFTSRDVQDLLQRPDFVQAATELQASIAPQGVSTEAWSSWSPEEKQAFQRQQQEVQALRAQLDSQQHSQVISQADEQLKVQYPDYDSSKVNDFYRRAERNELNPTELREAVYWAINGKNLVSRAYNMGQEDKNSNLKEQLNGLSPQGINMTPTTQVVVERKPGERTSSAFSQHAHKVLEMLRNQPRK